MIFETERLYLREMEQSDYEALCKILKEHSVMMKCRNGLTDRLPVIKNGDLVYGRLF